jgi:hypothetical protein
MHTKPLLQGHVNLRSHKGEIDVLLQDVRVQFIAVLGYLALYSENLLDLVNLWVLKNLADN